MNGFILKQIGFDDLSFDTINYCNANKSTLFIENISLHKFICNFPIMNISEIHKFNGNLYAFNIEHARLLLKSQSNFKPYLYLWDLEWLRKSSDYINNLNVLRKIPVLVRSIDHSLIVENYSNLKPSIIPCHYQLPK